MLRNTPFLFILVLSILILSCDSLFGDKTKSYKIILNSSPVEGGSVSPATGTYKEGEVVTLTATPSNGWKFVRWEGDWSSIQNPSQLSLLKNYSIVGVFEKRDYPLNITVVGQGQVEEKVVPSKTYPYQTVVELKAIPATGWEFASWSGDMSGSQNPQNITISGDKTVTATFQRKSYPLNITIEGEGAVQERVVTAKSYPYQTVVELTPIPATGWEFSSWGGDLSGSQQPQTITVIDTKNVIARFQKRSYPLNITIVGQGQVEEKVVPSKTYPYLTVVELTPVAAPGWRFNGWSGDLSGITVPGKITVNNAKNVTATFIVIAFLADNGVTIKCPNGKVGEKGVVNGVEYEVVDRNLLMQRRDQGADLTKVCTSLLSDLSDLFLNMLFNQPIGNWDVSNVTTMSRLFMSSTFNQPVSNWDVSKVSNMNRLFNNSPFNQPIGNWDVSSLIIGSDLFLGSNFNQPIAGWDVSNVVDMSRMFASSPFDQPIGDWNVSSVTNMHAMFFNSAFNQPIDRWDVSKVTLMRSMFRGYSNSSKNTFNQSLKNWNVSSVTDMKWMFMNSLFNQDISDWDVGNVTNMEEMFTYADFNRPISRWNVSKVNNMNSMFSHSLFNQNISNWCVRNIISEPNNFSTNSPLIRQNKPIWGTCPSN